MCYQSLLVWSISLRAQLLSILAILSGITSSWVSGVLLQGYQMNSHYWCLLMPWFEGLSIHQGRL